MPRQIIKSPGDTEQRAIAAGNSSDWNTVHGQDGTSASDVFFVAASAGNRVTQVRLLGVNYIISRGVLAYDFRTANAPRGIKVVRAQLVIGGTSVAASDTNGDKIRIGVITNPTNPGEVSIVKTDYDLTRYDANSYTSAQAVPNGAINVAVNLNNSILLNQLSKSINKRGVLHLSVRNELDFLDDPSDVTGLNRAWFSPPSAQGGSFTNKSLAELRIFYRIVNNRRNPGGRGAGGVASSGFGGTSMFSGTNSGFSS